MATSKKERGMLLLELVESLAILHDLQFCLQLRISNLTMKSNCQYVVIELQGSQVSLSPQGNIFQDIKVLMGLF